MVTETTLDIRSLREQAARLPSMKHERPADQVLAVADRHVKFWAKSFEKFDFKAQMQCHDSYKEKYLKHCERITALMMTSALMNVTQQEAMTAGTDLPTFTKVVLLTVKRVYPRLFATQLFGTLPMSGPTGRLWFKDFKYDDNFTGSSPNIAQGDRTDETSKFNEDYYAVAELEQARKLKFDYAHLDFAATDFRVVADLTDQFKDDVSNVYNDDAEGSSYDHIAQEMARVIDRKLIGAVYNNVPGANSHTWDATPADVGNGSAYEALAPSEKKAYDELLWNNIQETINKIRVTRKFNTDGDPSWLLVGANFALRLWKLTAFKPLVQSLTVAGLGQGALRDIGTIDTLGIRVLVDPMLNTETGLFGRMPAQGDPGIYFAPYIPYQVLRDSYDTDTGRQTIGARARFGIVKPNTGTQSRSSQLSEIYGKLVVTA